MDINITVKLNEERHKALKKYLKSKANSTIEQELERALEKLYSRYVPTTVREYLEENEDEGAAQQE